MERKWMNNKGVSLVEVMVALAVGGIVLAALSLLIVQGINNYREQTATASIQNEANIALNQMSEHIMEGTCLEFSADNEGDTVYVKVKDKVYFVFDKSSGILYQSETNSLVNAAVLCKHLNDFKVRLIDSCLIINETNNTVDGICNPIQIKVDIEIERMDVTRTVSRTVCMRNDMDKIGFMINGTMPSDFMYQDVSTLGAYITSDN